MSKWMLLWLQKKNLSTGTKLNDCDLPQDKQNVQLKTNWSLKGDTFGTFRQCWVVEGLIFLYSSYLLVQALCFLIQSMPFYAHLRVNSILLHLFGHFIKIE